MPVSVVSCTFHSFVFLPCTYCEPLAIIGLATGEEGAERVVGWDGKAGSVDQELAGNVKEDEEEVQGAEAECDVDLGDAGLLLEVVEDGVFAELVGPSVCARYTCTSQRIGRMAEKRTSLSSAERWYWALRGLSAWCSAKLTAISSRTGSTQARTATMDCPRAQHGNVQGRRRRLVQLVSCQTPMMPPYSNVRVPCVQTRGKPAGRGRGSCGECGVAGAQHQDWRDAPFLDASCLRHGDVGEMSADV